MTLVSLAHHVREIQTLVLSFHPAIVIETVEEERVKALLQTATKDMNLPFYEWTIVQGLIRSPGSYEAPWINEYAPPGSQKPVPADNTHEPLPLLRYIRDMSTSGVFWLKDLSKHLDEPVIIRQLRELIEVFIHTRSAMILTGNSIELPPEILPNVVYFDLKLPATDELYQTAKDTLRILKLKHRKQIELQEEDMKNIVHAITGMTLQQARQVLAYAAFDDGKLTPEDIKLILNRKAQVIREGSLLEYLPLDDLKTDLGGFLGLKCWLDQVRVGFSAQAKSLNLKAPKGILIVGIQGCGKSLAAKAIARAWSMPLLKLEAGRIYDKYIGESEKNLRYAVTLAESMAPTLLWIDEIEKGFSTTSGDADGGLSKRLFGFFLTWMQEKSQEVFVVATANDISQIPPELLRKGRFDEIFFVDLPNAQERSSILQIHLLQRKQVPEQLNLQALVEALDGFSGAEIEQAVIAGLYKALYVKQPLDTELMLQQIRSMIPLSVSRRENLQQLRSLAKERFVSVH
jgi:DNA polymerase III delta prime subunit